MLLLSTSRHPPPPWALLVQPPWRHRPLPWHLGPVFCWIVGRCQSWMMKRKADDKEEGG